jgi:hypothetical protein
MKCADRLRGSCPPHGVEERTTGFAYQSSGVAGRFRPYLRRVSTVTRELRTLFPCAPCICGFPGPSKIMRSRNNRSSRSPDRPIPKCELPPSPCSPETTDTRVGISASEGSVSGPPAGTCGARRSVRCEQPSPRALPRLGQRSFLDLRHVRAAARTPHNMRHHYQRRRSYIAPPPQRRRASSGTPLELPEWDVSAQEGGECWPMQQPCVRDVSGY